MKTSKINPVFDEGFTSDWHAPNPYLPTSESSDIFYIGRFYKSQGWLRVNVRPSRGYTYKTSDGGVWRVTKYGGVERVGEIR